MFGYNFEIKIEHLHAFKLRPLAVTTRLKIATSLNSCYNINAGVKLLS